MAGQYNNKQTDGLSVFVPNISWKSEIRWYWKSSYQNMFSVFYYIPTRSQLKSRSVKSYKTIRIAFIGSFEMIVMHKIPVRQPHNSIAFSMRHSNMHAFSVYLVSSNGVWFVISDENNLQFLCFGLNTLIRWLEMISLMLTVNFSKVYPINLWILFGMHFLYLEDFVCWMKILGIGMTS